MKYLCEPVKYKQWYRWEAPCGYVNKRRYCWAHFIPFILNDGWRWIPNCHRYNLAVIYHARRGKYPKGFYVAPMGIPEDIDYTMEYWNGIPMRVLQGPYPDLPTAKMIVETYITLKHAPVWQWKKLKS